MSRHLMTAAHTALAVLLACDGTARSAALALSPSSAVTRVEVSPPSPELMVGEVLQMAATPLDAQGNIVPQAVSWTIVSGPSSAQISQAGLARAAAPGSAVIQAEAKGVVGQTTLVVKDSARTPTPPPPPPTGTPVTVAELPRQWVNSTYVPPTGKTITVNAGGDLQAAINSAARGDVIMLQPGATFTGEFVLPNKPGTGWITIRSAAPDANLPAAGQRITPAFSAQLPKLVSKTGTNTVISTQPGARFYRLMFLEVTLGSGMTGINSLVRLGDPSADQTTGMPSDLVIDRSYLHGTPTSELRRCLLLSSAWTAVVDSYLSDCHETGFDSQAIVGWNGRGPYKITNNYLSGAGETILFGGALPATPGLIPADIEIRGNYLHKPATWKSSSWQIKNIFELKIGRRILFEGNVLDGNWQQAQTGYAINVKTSTEMTTGITEDVTIRNNIIRNSGAGIVLLAYEAGSTLSATRITITNNVMRDINVGIYTGAASLLTILGTVQHVLVEHNTFVSDGPLNTAIQFDQPAAQGFAFRNNIVHRGAYGVKGGGTGEGSATLARFAPGGDFRNNVLIGVTSNPYPLSTWFQPSAASVGFVDFAAGKLSLSAGSPYKRKSLGGTDLGADITQVDSLTKDVTGR